MFMKAGNTYWKRGLSTVDLLLQINFDIANIIHFFPNQATSIRRSTVLNLSLQLVFLDKSLTTSIKACLHNGKNHAKLVGFKEHKTYYVFLKPTSLARISP
jgi:hypothetical protein